MTVTELIIRDGMLASESMVMIAAVEAETASMIAKRDQLRHSLKAAMEAQGVKKIDTDTLSVTYVEPTDRERFDSKALREDMPEIYDAYVSMSPVKSQIRIKLK